MSKYWIQVLILSLCFNVYGQNFDEDLELLLRPSRGSCHFYDLILTFNRNPIPNVDDWTVNGQSVLDEQDLTETFLPLIESTLANLSIARNSRLSALRDAELSLLRDEYNNLEGYSYIDLSRQFRDKLVRRRVHQPPGINDLYPLHNFESVTARRSSLYSAGVSRRQKEFRLSFRIDNLQYYSDIFVYFTEALEQNLLNQNWVGSDGRALQLTEENFIVPSHGNYPQAWDECQ